MNSNEVNHLGSINCTQNYTQNYTYASDTVQKGSLEFFKLVCLPSVLFALIATFSRYDNIGSIMDAVWTSSALVFILYVSKRLGQKWNRQMIFPAAALVLFGISNMLTQNTTILYMNILACKCLILLLAILAFYPNRNWQMGQWIVAGVTSVLKSVVTLADWGADFAITVKSRSKKGHALQILIGLVIAIPLTIIILLLLAAADSVFQTYVIDFFDFDLFTITYKLLMLSFFYFGSYCGIRFLNKKTELVKEGETKQYPALTAYIILLPLTFIYLLFSWIQFAYLMIGNMKLPEGVTYSEYAHQGFNQLIVVVVINLVIVLFTIGVFGRTRGIRAALTVFTACTFVMIASAFVRIFMYIGAYHLTELRFLVVWGLSMLTLIFAIVLIYVFCEKFQMARWFFVITTLGCLVLSYCRMDAIIARYNISHMPELNQDNYEYLVELSTDACDEIFATKNQDLIDLYVLYHDKGASQMHYTWRMKNFSYDHFKNNIDCSTCM